MPIYEYRCAKCGASHDINQRMADDPLTQCPTCNEEGLERLVSASSFALKGGGWYADGYGEEKKKPDKTKSEAKAETKSDTKAETKTETEKKPDKKTKDKSGSSGTAD